MENDDIAKQIADIKDIADRLNSHGTTSESALSTLADVRQKLDNLQSLAVQQALRTLLIKAIPSPACTYLDQVYTIVQERFAGQIPRLQDRFLETFSVLEADHYVALAPPVVRMGRTRRALSKAVRVSKGGTFVTITLLPDVHSQSTESSLLAAGYHFALEALIKVFRGDFAAATLVGLGHEILLLPRLEGGADFVVPHDVSTRDILQVGFCNDFNDLAAKILANERDLTDLIHRIYTRNDYESLAGLLASVPQDHAEYAEAKWRIHFLDDVLGKGTDPNDDVATIHYYEAVLAAAALRLIPLKELPKWMDWFPSPN